MKKLLDPVCSISRGTPPPRFIDLANFESEIDAKAAKAVDSDIDYSDDEFVGGDLYNEEDLENLADDTDPF